MRIASCNNNSLDRLIRREAALGDLEKVVEAASSNNDPEDVLPALRMIVSANHDVLEEMDLKGTLSRLAAKGVKVAWAEGFMGGLGGALEGIQKGWQSGAQGAKVQKAKQQAIQALQNLMQVDPEAHKIVGNVITQLSPAGAADAQQGQQQQQQNLQQIPPQQAAQELAQQSQGPQGMQPQRMQPQRAGQAQASPMAALNNLMRQNAGNESFNNDLQALIQKYSPQQALPGAGPGTPGVRVPAGK